MPTVSDLTGLNYSAGEINAILEASVILCGIFYAFMSLKHVYTSGRLRIPLAGILFLAVSVFFAAVLVLTDIPVIGASACGAGAFFALVPVVVPFGIFGVESLARRVKYHS